MVLHAVSPGEVHVNKFSVYDSEFARPTDDEGNNIHEKDIGDWLRYRGLVWTCLCPSKDGEGNMVALIDHETDGDTLRCGEQTGSTCEFESERDVSS